MGLYSLGHDLQRERPSQRHHRAGKAGLLGRRALAQERAIHLQDVDRKHTQVAER